ncbi:MAG: putative ABC transporter permease [Eubacteriales bacterium]|nr:putative ABC transporter permease [Eubacteriales bacterium]
MVINFDYPLITEICYFFLMFAVFSVAGWLTEVSLKYIQFHRFINRGFLIGPYCPIYGTGSVLVTLAVYFCAGPDAGYFETFLISFVFCGALEYFVSWYMEKVFHARWWDYSEKPMNLEGRIWIGNLILFGLGGLIIVKLIAPVLFTAFEKIPHQLLLILCTCIFVIMSADYVISHVITAMVKKVGESSKEDNTEEISKEVRRILASASIFHRRLMDAYPNMQARTTKIQQRLKEDRQKLRLKLKEERRLLYMKKR